MCLIIVEFDVEVDEEGNIKSGLIYYFRKKDTFYF